MYTCNIVRMDNQFDSRSDTFSTTAAKRLLVSGELLSTEKMSQHSTERVFVKPIDENGVERECLAVPLLANSEQTVAEFKKDLLCRLKFPTAEKCDGDYEMRLSSNGALLQDCDRVTALLRSNDFVTICK